MVSLAAATGKASTRLVELQIHPAAVVTVAATKKHVFPFDAFFRKI